MLLNCGVHPNGDQSWVFIGRLILKLKLQYFGHLMRRADSFEKTLMMGKIEGRRRRGQQRIRLLDGTTDSMDMPFGGSQEMVLDREAWRAVVHEVTKSRTWLSDWTENHWRWWLQPWHSKTLAPWKDSYDQPRQHIKEQRHYFVNKGPSSQGYGFSSSPVWMWEWTIKKA